MTVYQAFNAVQKDMADHGIAKNQQNKSGSYGYKYRGIDDVYNTLGPIMAKHGLLIIPRVMDSSYEVGTTKNGGTAYHHRVVVEYNVFGPEGDRMEPTPISRGECIDTSDKGLNKALSAAYKYWVLSAFCVPLEGQEDADSVTPEAVQPAADRAINPEEKKEILGLCMQTNTNVEQFVGWLGYNNMTEIPVSKLAYAKDALHQKLQKMSHEYEADQRADAQTMNQGV